MFPYTIQFFKNGNFFHESYEMRYKYFRIDTFTDIKTDRSFFRLSIGFIQLSITPGLCFFPSIIESSISFNHSTIEKRSAFQVSSKQVMVNQPNKWLQAETCPRHILIRIFTFYVTYLSNVLRLILNRSAYFNNYEFLL